MFSIAAINETESKGKWEPLAPTKEAQEFHLSQTYHDGLLKIQAKDYEKARELLEAVLKDPLISNAQIDNAASDHHLLQLRFLSLKNLANVFLQQGSLHYESALQCYLQAVELDQNDSVVWNHLGTLSCKMGLLSTSRWAFEQGLVCSPTNWNCMEKLLEVLIAIGDEVACLCIANLILRHWPSHSRALHVKKTIEDAEPIPFAPRGIDKLEPKHVRLRFPEKRKLTDNETDSNATTKRPKQTLELQLTGVTWLALLDAVLNVFLSSITKVSEPGALDDHDNAVNEKLGHRHRKEILDSTITDKENLGDKSLAYVHIDIKLPESSEIIMDSEEGNVNGLCHRSECTLLESHVLEKSTIVKGKYLGTDREHHQERRSTRLERLRSRKLGKEELEASGKDQAKLVIQPLEPFVLKKPTTEDSGGSTSYAGAFHDSLSYTSILEHNDVVEFTSKASKVYGAYHLAHLLLEEVAYKCIYLQASSEKILELEKLTRNWGRDRSMLCSLFLAELYYDQGSCSEDKSKQLQYLSEANYHLCKVVELVTLESPDDLLHNHLGSKVMKEMDDIEDTSILLDGRDKQNALPSNGPQTKLCNSTHQEKNESTSTNDAALWVRFFWLCGRLSLSQDCKSKAFNEFSICLSLLRNIKNSKETSDFVFLPHCELVKLINFDRVLHEINLLKLDSLLEKAADEMMEKGMYSECIDMLAPLLLPSKDMCIDLVFDVLKGSESVTSMELSAIDLLISACENTETMDIQVYLNCHRRKLQVLTASTGMVGSSNRSKSSMPKASDCLDLDVTESTNKKWRQMVAEEVKDVSQAATRVKSSLDQANAYVGFDSLIPIISDIQSLLLTVMCSTVRTILGQKFSSSTISNQADQLETWCLIDAAIAFCKLQHLHPSVCIKTHVDLIVAVHDLLAELGLCCAGRDGERDEGTYLKFAIKHLLALDVKLKSLSGTNGEEEVASLQKKEGDDSTTLETKGKDKETLEPGKKPVDTKLDSSTEECQSVTTGDPSNSVNLLTDEEIEEVELSIDNALDQSFFCLYGLKINPDSSNEEELAVHKNTSRGDYQTKEQCADVFHYILPYAKALSRAGLVKLRRVLRAIRKHFPQPPDDMLANDLIDKFLDGPNEWEDKLCQVAGTSNNQELIMSILFANGRGTPDAMMKSTILSSEQYLEVYGNLYYYIAQAEEISATDKYPGFVLKKEGEEFVEQNANLFKYDLLYNPLRFESWQKLANIYDEEVDLLLNDGSKHINILDWRKNTTLIQRVEAGRRRSRRCFLMSLALASSQTQQSQIHELLALVYYDSLQNVAPFYDQRSVLPVKDAVWMSFCQSALGHFEKAFALKSEWLHAFYLGKLCEKIGFSPEKALSYYSKAASLNPSGVDPVYRMHASRVKLLYKQGKTNLDIIQIVAAYAFSQSTKETIQTLFNWTNQDLQESTLDMKNVNDQDALKEKRNIDPNLLDKAWHILYDDCLLGLGICVEGELKHFHKARYALAQGLYKRGKTGDLERARDELSFCFKSSRSSFTINMWEIDGATRKGRRKNPGVAGNKKCLEVSLSESSRKFITCIRKYLLLYLNLLEKSEDLWTLEKGYSYLRTDKRFSLCLGDIVPVALGKYIQVLISTIHNMETQNPTDRATSLEQMLEKLFNIFMDHINLWADISSLPELNKPELLESNVYCYIHQYIHLLESDIRLDSLEAINEKIRKRSKNPKLSNSNFAKICKHASLAWCRSITIKLALITPLPILELNDQPHTGAVENGLLLYVDLQPDELLISPLDDPAQSRGLDMNWFEALSKIKNMRIKQASEENMEAAVALLRCTYNFYRESSCGTFPSGINLYTVFLSPTTVEGTSQQEKDVVGVLDLSIPRKLLLWAYTLVHGRYSNISAVVKYCEEAKSRMKRGGVMMTQTSMQTNVPPVGAHTAVPCREKMDRSDHVEIEDHSVIPVASSMHPVDVAYIPSSSNEVHKTSSQLQRCNSSKGQEPCKTNTIADLNSTDN